MKIFRSCLLLSKNKKIKPFTLENLECALLDLKINKSRDPEGYINELFKKDMIGDNLKTSLLIFFNNLKTEHIFPLYMRQSNITTIHKSGSKMELKNQRGVSRTSVVRSIFKRMLYNIKYESIDQNISDGQMGGRKNKGCRNNLFIVNAIIFDVLKSKTSKPVTLQIYDYSQMFDAINLEQALIDLYDCGVQDETISLLYEANKEIEMAIKSPFGLTERQTVKSTVLQGETWASLLASDKLIQLPRNANQQVFITIINKFIQYQIWVS